MKKPTSMPTPTQNMDEVLNGLLKDREPVTKVEIEMVDAPILRPRNAYSFNT